MDVSEGETDMATETSEKSQDFAAENLELKPQLPVIIPRKLRDSELMNQRPETGNVIFVDSRDPDTATIINQKTWGPILKKGKPETLKISNIALKRFPAVILHTPPRTPENSQGELIKKLSGLLKISYEKKGGIFVNQRLGVLAIVEDSSKDKRVGWRKKELSGIKIYLNGKEKPAVVKAEVIRTEGENYLITMGRRPMKSNVPDFVTLRHGSRFTPEPNKPERHNPFCGDDPEHGEMRRNKKGVAYCESCRAEGKY